MTNIMNTTNPTRGLFPITKDPKVSTTPPASAVAKMDLVVDTVKPRRNNVSNNNKDEQMENFNCSCIFIDNNMTINAKEILHKISTLNSHPGNGMTNIIIIKITPNKTDKSRNFM